MDPGILHTVRHRPSPAGFLMWRHSAGLRSTLSMADINEGFVKNTESTFGKPDDSREAVRNARRVVVKVLLLSMCSQLILCNMQHTRRVTNCD